VELGASVMAQLDDAGVAPGGHGELTLWPGASRLGARLSLSGTRMFSRPIAGGEAAWTRVQVGLGPSYRLSLGRRMLLDLQLELVNAVVILEGRGFPTTRRSLGYDPALAAGARLGWRQMRWARGAVVPFVGVAFVGWLRAQELYLDGSDEELRLPRLDVLLRAGIAFGN
jgi:hypothetical protein